MADRWMDERDRDWRERDWRRSEALGRSGADRGRTGEPGRFDEDRSWADAAREDDARRQELRRRRAYEPDYAQRSSIVRGGPQAWRGPQDDYARSYRADRDRDERREWREADRGDEDHFRRSRLDGAYGHDRGYRGEPAPRERWERPEDGERHEDFLQRAGERISAWFRGGHHEAVEDERRYDELRPARGHRGRGPKGYQRTDARITEDVSDRLTEDPWLDASEIEVEVKAGEVTLSGHVDNREAKHRAERLIEDLSGVRHVQNNLRVDPNAAFTGAGRGFGSSALEAEMRRNELANSPANHGSAGAAPKKPG